VTAGKPVKVLILIDNGEFWLAEDANQNLLLSTVVLTAGLIVNNSRDAVVKFRATLSDEEKKQIRMSCKSQRVMGLRMPQ
jgi:hypothetical protein